MSATFCKSLSAIILAFVVFINTIGNFIGVGDIIPTAPAETTTVTTETTVEESTEVSEETAAVIALYNNSVNKAYDSRVGFSKERYADNDSIRTDSLFFKTLKDQIYMFMGVGEGNRYIMNVAKGEWESDVPHHYLRKSTLSEEDIISASCTESDGKYAIVINVKDGSSKGAKTGSYNNSPIDKCGICVGETDKSYFDHKTGPVIYSAIRGVVENAVVEESYNNAVVKAEIDAESGNLISLTVEYDMAYDIDGGSVGVGYATATNHIIYKNFQY